MSFEPIVSPIGICYQRYVQLIGILHFLYYDLLYFLFLFGINREVEFVVYLDDHFALDVFSLKAFEDAHHGHLDNVGLGTLDRSIDGIAFGKSTHSAIVTVDVWQIAATVEEGFGIAFFRTISLDFSMYALMPGKVWK